MIAAAMAMQNAELTPTASQVDAVTRARAQGADVMGRWNSLKGAELTALNAKRRAAVFRRSVHLPRTSACAGYDASIARRRLRAGT